MLHFLGRSQRGGYDGQRGGSSREGGNSRGESLMSSMTLQM